MDVSLPENQDHQDSSLGGNLFLEKNIFVAEQRKKKYENQIKLNYDHSFQKYFSRRHFCQMVLLLTIYKYIYLTLLEYSLHAHFRKP